jgi:ParB family transcriptional regulator, chromosome partitioning protein
MARKRLIPGDFDQSAYEMPSLETKSITRLSAHPPIAHIAGEASAAAALAEISASVIEARNDGRMVVALPLNDVIANHLLRDRISASDDENAALIDSMREHGQRQPIDVTALPLNDGSEKWGLISGWRRLSALKALYEETGDPRFARVQALVRKPQNAAAAYTAMIEENEIRADLSHYERARIVALAVQDGVFDSERAALRGLFGHVSRAKRSKIGSFIVVYRALDQYLRFPTMISERLGLRLAEKITDGFATSLQAALERAGATSASAEAAALEAAMASKIRPEAETQTIIPGVDMEIRRSGARMRLIFSGDMVDEALAKAIAKAIRPPLSRG